MEPETKLTIAKSQNQKKWKKYSLSIVIILISTLTIAMLSVLDYLDIESFKYFNEKTYPQYRPTRFVFEETWKGRMFYLFFIWLFFMENLIDLERVVEKRPRSKLRVACSLILLLMPTAYIIIINSTHGLSEQIISLGQKLGVIGDITFENSLTYDWPLSFEHLIFFSFYISAIIVAYGKTGLNTFSISLSLLGVITLVYMIDTFYPMGLFTPLQLFALPTAACAVAFLTLLGYKSFLRFPVPYQVGQQISYVPVLGIEDTQSRAYIGWPCAGVHSILLFIIIICLLFKRSKISSFRKVIYFIIGLFGTYFVNILRISTIVIIGIESRNAAKIFHDYYAELYFFMWMFAYISLILAIQKYMVVERTKNAFKNAFKIINHYFREAKN